MHDVDVFRKTRLWRWAALVIFVAVGCACLPFARAETFFECPDAARWERCFNVYDKDKSRGLDQKEFAAAWDKLSFYVRWALEKASHYFDRCDYDKSGDISAWELMSGDCIGGCVKQSKVYGDLCM